MYSRITDLAEDASWCYHKGVREEKGGNAMKCDTKKTLWNLLKLFLIWCVSLSVYKTQEANKAAKKRREERELAAQEWEFDRIYPGSLRDR